MTLKDDLAASTPGPWVYEKADGSIVWGSPDVLTVARFHCGRNDHGNDARPSMANARLIARAPDMAAEVLDLRAKLAEAEKALDAVLNACDQGRMHPAPGCASGGMTIEANIRGSVYSGVPAWPIEEARAALARIREVTEC